MTHVRWPDEKDPTKDATLCGVSAGPLATLDPSIFLKRWADAFMVHNPDSLCLGCRYLLAVLRRKAVQERRDMDINPPTQ